MSIYPGFRENHFDMLSISNQVHNQRSVFPPWILLQLCCEFDRWAQESLSLNPAVREAPANWNPASPHITSPAIFTVKGENSAVWWVLFHSTFPHIYTGVTLLHRCCRTTELNFQVGNKVHWGQTSTPSYSSTSCLWKLAWKKYMAAEMLKKCHKW